MTADRDAPLPPSEVASRRDSAVPRGRAYPVVEAGDDDVAALEVRLAATRALLTATTPDDVVDVVATFVRDLGGELVPARLAADGAVPVDVALGVREPTLVHVPSPSVAALRLSASLPELVEDARGVVERLRAAGRRAAEAELDPVTGLLTRRALMRRLSAAAPGDAVALLDLDRFKQVNDTGGHAAGDSVLHAVGTVLRAHLRDVDACGRYGGDELAVLAGTLSPAALAARLETVRAAWRDARPATAADVGFSAGVAAVGLDGGAAALQAADRALYRAKAAGRDRTELAEGGAG